MSIPKRTNYTFHVKKIKFSIQKRKQKYPSSYIVLATTASWQTMCSCLYVTFPSFRSAKFTNKLKTYTENLNKIQLLRVTQYIPSHRDHDNILENISLEEQWKNIMQSCLLKNNFIQVTLHNPPPPTILLLYIYCYYCSCCCKHIHWMENDDDLFRLGLKYFINRNSEVFQHGGSRVASFV